MQIQPGPGSKALIAAAEKMQSTPKRKKKRPPFAVPPQANGQTINGASTSSTRVGY